MAVGFFKLLEIYIPVLGKAMTQQPGPYEFMKYRLHVCLKSTLLFAIVISLSAAFAQPSPTRSDSIVVFAPHPDD
jgi:hypothetical protein